MKNLLYKEFHLSIHPLFYLVAMLGALLLIPNWLYFIALSYVFFISISNIFSTSKAQNDIGFSVLLPVSKRDVVKAKIIAVIALELLHLAVAAIFGVVNHFIYVRDNMFLEPNAAFFGFGFMMYAIFNIMFFPMFYKTGYKVGLPIIYATITAVLFAAGVETFALIVPAAKTALDSDMSSMLLWKIGVLVAGIIIFTLSAVASYKLSARRFEKIDL